MPIFIMAGKQHWLGLAVVESKFTGGQHVFCQHYKLVDNNWSPLPMIAALSEHHVGIAESELYLRRYVLVRMSRT